MRNFESKVALVTGGASGIGLALSTELAKHKATVIVDVTEARADKERTRKYKVIFFERQSSGEWQIESYDRQH